MTDRERFEEWAGREGYSLDRIKAAPDLYRASYTASVWAAWQAAVAAERKRLVEAHRQKRDDAGGTWQDRDNWLDGYRAAMVWAIQQITEGK